MVTVYTLTCKQKLMPSRAIHMKAWIMDTMTPITAFCLTCIEQMLAAHLRLSVQGEMNLLNILLAVFLVFSEFCFQRCMRGGKRGPFLCMCWGSFHVILNHTSLMI